MASPTPMEGVVLAAGAQPVAKNEVTVEVLEEVDVIPEEIEKKFVEWDAKIDKTRFAKVAIHNFSLIKDTMGRIELPEFTFVGLQWRFLCFPRGNNNEAHVSVYLDYLGPKKEPWWGFPVQFVLTPHSEDDELTFSNSKEAKHRFTNSESDWGFTQFVKKNQFYSDEPGKRFIVDDTVVISVALHIMHDPYGTLLNNFVHYDSKQMTGFNGLKNQGATCYMNSILQSLYFTNVFRKAVFQIPLEDEKTKNVSYALQKVFFNLQNSLHPVGTTELTKSFGWDLVDSFMQHDVQEFNRVLCDKLETKMKGSPAEGTVQKLLEGQYKMYIKCINVDYESSRVEPFYDIQLNVKGLKNLEESFKNYVEIEVMDGDNKYQAAGHGLQDAKKGVIFEKFPQVLHLQLKRFEYDFMRDANIKINDRHEFPLSIDLRPYMNNPDAQEPQIYHLHGVLVHSGDSHGGHYCAFIRPKPHGGWFKFDDDRVTQCSQKEAVDDNFGVDMTETPLDAPVANVRTMRAQRKFTNAYMLVYIRETELDEVLKEVTEADIPVAIRERIEKEREELERKRLEREQDVNYMDVHVVTDEIIKHHTNHADLFIRRPDVNMWSPMNRDDQSKNLQPPANQAKVYRVKKSMTLEELKDQIAKEHGLPGSKFIRVWNIVQRQNATTRPDGTFEHDNVTLEQLAKEAKNKIGVNIYVQFPEQGADLSNPNTAFPPLTKDHILLFFKTFDPVTERLQYTGNLLARSHDRLVDIIEHANKLCGFPPKTPIKAFEEIRPDLLELIKSKNSFHAGEIGTGDIIILQKDLTTEQQNSVRFQTVKQYFEYLQHRTVIRFRQRDIPKVDAFSLTLHLKMTYEDVAKAVGEHLQMDPMKLKFYSHRNTPEGPNAEIKRVPEMTLDNMLNPYTYGTPSDIVYFEKLEISILELENKLPKEVTWMNALQREEAVFQLLLQKNDTVQAILDAVRPKISLRGEPKKPKVVVAAATVAPAIIADPAGPTPMTGVVPAPAATPTLDAAANEPTPMAGVAPAQPTTTEEKGSGILRAYEVKDGKILQVLDPKTPVKDVAHAVVVEEIPLDQLDTKDKIIQVAHFQRDVYNFHSLPFYYRLIQGETFADFKIRLLKTLGVSEKEFSKYRFAYVAKGEMKVDYFEVDTDVVSAKPWLEKDIFGIDHIDHKGKMSRYGTMEKALVIRN